MIAKIIAYGRDRDEALGRLRRAMAETTVIIEGGATNKSFVLDLLDQPEVIDASADTGWIDRVRGEGRLVSHRHSAVALAAAAIEAYEEEERVERQRLLSTAFGGRPQVQHESGRPLDLKLRGVGYRVRVARVGAHRFRVGIEAGGEVRTADVELDRFDRHTGQIVVNGTRYRLLTGTHGPIHLVEVDGVTHRVSRDEGGVLRSPMPALVVATPLAVGAEVEAGAPVLVLESMKMETVLRAPFRARLKECVVVGGQPGGGRRAAAAAGAARRRRGRGRRRPPGPSSWTCPPAPAEVPARQRCRRGQEDLRSLLLGFDVDPHDERRVLDDYLAARRAAAEDGHRPLAEELELLDVFADLAELSRNRPAGEDGGDTHVHSAREYFHTYLQSLDVERAGLPETFQARLGQGARPLRRHRPGAHARARGRGVPDLPRPAARRRRRRRRHDAAARLAAGAAAGRDAARARRSRAGAAGGGDAGPLPGGRRPGPRRGVRLVRPAAAAPQPRPRLRRRPQAPAPPGRAPGRAGPRRAHRRDGAQHRAAGAAARPAARPRRPGQRGHAGGADPAVLRQQGAHRRAHQRGRGLHVRGRRAGRLARGLRRGELRRAGRRAARARRAGHRRGRRSTPTSTSPGRASRRTPTRWRPRCTRWSARTRCRTRSAGSPPPSRAAAAR